MMKSNIATYRFQSARLLSAGVKPETADMYWDNYNTIWAAAFKDCARKSENGFAPAWSLSALLTKVLPSEISRDATGYGLKIFCKDDMQNGIAWEIFYTDDMFVSASDPIEACVRMVEKLHANGHPLNQTEV